MRPNLDGHSGNDNSALVNMGNQPIVSFNEDHENGAWFVAISQPPDLFNRTAVIARAFDVASRQQVAL